MREIKFRGLHRNSGKMCFSDDYGLVEFFKKVEIHDIELRGQYTGLKDKNGNGKEVYQDDLIRPLPNGNEPREIYRVVWNDRTLMWSIENTLGGYSPLWAFIKDFEIIGNIYENPELIAN